MTVGKMRRKKLMVLGKESQGRDLLRWTWESFLEEKLLSKQTWNRRKFDDNNHVQQMQAKKSESESHSVASDSLGPHWLFSPWNSPGQNTGVGSLSFLQGIFPIQEMNQSLLSCRWILYQLSHQGNSGLNVVTFKFQSYDLRFIFCTTFMMIA